MKQTTKVRIVRVDKNDEQITLSVNVGFAQPSSTTVYVEGKILFTNKDSFVNQPIGTKNELFEKEVLVVTAASDIDENTNILDVTHILGPNIPESTVNFHDMVENREVAIDITRYIITQKL